MESASNTFLVLWLIALSILNRLQSELMALMVRSILYTPPLRLFKSFLCNLSTGSCMDHLEKGINICLFVFLQMSGDPGVSAFPEEDNIFCWKGTITGSQDTVFEGTEYKLSLSFPNDYPFKAPKVKFETTCFHPNVDVHGNICLDILQVVYELLFVSF